MALAIAVYDRTHSALAVTGLFLALEFLPALVAPPLTARLDRIPTRTVLPALYAAEGAVFCILAVLVDSFSLVPFLALVAVDGALGVVARALARGAVAAVLEPTGELRAGNALLNLALAPNMALGGVIGAVAVAGLGAGAALLINAATFGLGALLLATAHGLPRYDADDVEPEHWRVRLSAAYAYVRANRHLLVMLIGQAAALVFFALTEPIEVGYTRTALDAGPGGYGALIGAWGVGVMVGSALYTWVGARTLALTTLVSTVGIGAAYLGLAAAGNIAAACAIAVVGGAANGAQMVAIGTAVQEAIALEFQARVMSFYEALTTAAPGIGYLLGGLLGATLGARPAFVVAGAGIFAVAACVLLAWPRGMRAPAGPRPDVSSA